MLWDDHKSNPQIAGSGFRLTLEEVYFFLSNLSCKFLFIGTKATIFWWTANINKIKWMIMHCKKKKIFFIKDFFSKPDQICREFRIWSHLLKESLMKNFIFYAVMNERGIKCSNFPWRTLEIFKREVKLEHPFTDFVCKLWKYTFYGAWKDT